MPRFTLRRRDSVSEIVFDDGQMNLLSAAALEELDARLAELGDTKLLVLRSGREKLFAAGADMAAMQGFSAADAEAFSALGQRVFARIERLDALTVAIVDGDCYGGALDLALAFDLRWATTRSRFAHPGARIGIVTGFGGTLRVPQKVSPELARRLLLANEVIPADDALRFGLADRLLEGADVAEAELDALAASYGVEAQVAKVLLRCHPALPHRELDLLARRTEQLLRGTTLSGSS